MGAARPRPRRRRGARLADRHVRDVQRGAQPHRHRLPADPGHRAGRRGRHRGRRQHRRRRHGRGVYAENRIAADTRAVITGDGAAGITAASVALHATDGSGIQALAGAASIAVSLAPSNAISVALALSIAFNEVSNHVEAAATGADQGITTTAGGVSALAEALGRPLFTFTPGGLVTTAGLDDAAVADLDDTTTPGTNEGTIDAAGDAPILTRSPGSPASTHCTAAGSST